MLLTFVVPKVHVIASAIARMRRATVGKKKLASIKAPLRAGADAS
jgi:hypothetical protein